MTFRNDSPLLSLIENENNEEAKAFIKNENLYNAVDTSRNTLLHYAAEYGNPEIVHFLIDSGSKVNAKNDVEQTPLCKSLYTDPPCAKVVDILLNAGADIYAYDHDEFVLHIVNDIEWLNIKRYEILKVMIERIFAIESEIYLFFLYEGNEQSMKLLLDTNINLDLADSNGKNLIHYLAEVSNPGMIEQLHGRNFDVDVRDNSGWTPLMYASMERNFDAMEFLLKEGADIEAVEIHYGRTALYIAIESIAQSNGDMIVQILLEHGANVQVATAIVGRETIFDLLLEFQEYPLAKHVLAHLALQEQLGTSISDLIRGKINSHRQFKSFYEDCQRQLSATIYSQVTLFDFLTANERQLERCLRNEKWASELSAWMQKECSVFKIGQTAFLQLSLINFPTKMGYFNKIFGQRISKAVRMVELRIAASKIICKLYKMDYERYPFIADEIVSYFEEEDMNCLLQVEH